MSLVEWTIDGRKVKLRDLKRYLIYFNGDVIAHCENLADYLENGAQFVDAIRKECELIQDNSHFYDFFLRKIDRSLNDRYIFNSVFSTWPVKLEVDNVIIDDVKTSFYEFTESSGDIISGFNFDNIPIIRKDFILSDDSTAQKLATYIEINGKTGKESWANALNTGTGDKLYIVISAPKEEPPIAGISSMKNYSWDKRMA